MAIRTYDNPRPADEEKFIVEEGWVPEDERPKDGA